MSLKRNIEIAMVNADNKRKRLWEKTNPMLISILNRIKGNFFAVCIVIISNEIRAHNYFYVN
jgi:hypothetical protein